MGKSTNFFDHYFFNLKKYLITYNKGFITIPFSANSPRAIVDSLSKVPFFKKSLNTIHSNSIIATGLLHHYELEKGLWSFISSTYHKKNVAVWGITNDVKHNYGKRNFNTRLFQSCKNYFTTWQIGEQIFT